jgi:hypothetical protein
MMTKTSPKNTAPFGSPNEKPGGAFFPAPYDKNPAIPFFKTRPPENDYHINAAYGSMVYHDIKFPV